MMFRIIEVRNIDRFLEEELPRSLGLVYPPENIKKYFNLKPKNGIWRTREKKQEKR